MNSTDARLAAALTRVAEVFRGMVAHPDEHNCACHWGTAEEIVLLKTPDVPLTPDLLYRTWSVGDWDDLASVFRRILPQLTVAMTNATRGHLPTLGALLRRTGWQQWPEQQSEAVTVFLNAWWAHTLQQSEPPTPARAVFVTCASATGTVTPWLDEWERQRHPIADHHLRRAAEVWITDLITDELPWQDADDREPELTAELNTWLSRHAPARLTARGAPVGLVHELRQLGTPIPARWDMERN
ncbi:hypothetical protein QR77_12710 [Streptomyces sp. 150FB]|uniref:hypothetical protein n=1 Tax=Streptomyces sp. 150FB TaxID=1576605 RepID=UPI000589124D|nr:hypothetical protein [Streptomyces sp. 150FB]KIF74601.1 hypothetical protein QR77_12710 [Streptomyces sp. 150FB]